MVFPGNFRKILACVNLGIFQLFYLLFKGRKESRFSITFSHKVSFDSNVTVSWVFHLINYLC
jgi:hypothetical protein